MEDQPRQALPLLEKTVQLKPYDLPVLTALGGVYQKVEQKDKAAEISKQAEEVQKIAMRLAELQQDANRHPWDDRVRVEIAGLYLRIQRLEQARTWLQAALACNPNNVQAHRLLAQLPLAKEKVPSFPDLTSAKGRKLKE